MTEAVVEEAIGSLRAVLQTDYDTLVNHKVVVEHLVNIRPQKSNGKRNKSMASLVVTQTNKGCIHHPETKSGVKSM